MFDSPFSIAFEDLHHELIAFDQAWTCPHERASLRHAAADLRHHLCALLAVDLPPERARYDALDGESRILAHEAFLSVLALGQLLLRAIDDRLAPEIAIARMQIVVDRMLDLLAPLVSRADDALRRVLLDNVPIEAALAEVGRAR